MPGREEIVKQLRILGKGARGASPAILELADSTLWEVFERLKRGLSCRSVARYLRSIGMKGSENSLQQSVSLFRKRIAPLLAKDEESAMLLPETPVKLPENSSSLPPDEMLSTLTDTIRFYGQAIRQETQAAAEKGTPLPESLTKQVKAYDTLIARKTRLEENVLKDRSVESTKEDPDDLRLLDLLANKVQEWLFDNGDGEKMVRASKRFLARIAQKCIYLKKDPVTGEWYEVKGFPGLNRTDDRNGFPIEDSEAQAES